MTGWFIRACIISTLHELFRVDAAAPICCHIGTLSFVMGMTERDMGM
jgi:hypothetical protein